MMRILLCLILAVSELIACAPQNDGAETQTPGEIAFRARCQTCHSLPRPLKYTDDAWPALVKRYGARAKLDDSTIALITVYLTSHN